MRVHANEVLLYIDIPCFTFVKKVKKANLYSALL